MTTASRSIVLSESQTLRPENCPELRDVFLDESQTTKAIVATLAKSRLLELTELRNGLEVRAFSYVGRIQVGDLTITIHPKLKGSSLLTLLRYAHGYRRLNLISNASQLAGPSGFEDLLIAQLNAEAQELISRGLQRSYIV